MVSSLPRSSGAAFAALLLLLPAAWAGAPVGPLPDGRVALVVAPDEEPQRVADTFTALALELGMTVSRADASDAASLRRALERAEGTLVVVAHGSEDGLRVGDDVLAWPAVALAIDASDATFAVLAACNSDVAVALMNTPAIGYPDLVDGRIAELDAFERAVNAEYRGDPLVAGEARNILWGYVERTYAEDSDLLLRFVIPLDPLYHDPNHREAHHTEANEHSFQDENRAGMSGGLAVKWFKLKFDRQFCGEAQQACGARAYFQIDASKCKTLVSVYDLAFPGAGQVIREVAAQMDAEADVLALKLCGTVFVKVLDGGEVQGGGSLYLRFGTFVEFKMRWFMEIRFALYIQGGFNVVVKSAHNDRHLYADWTFTIDVAAEGKLIYLYFNVNKNLAKGTTRMTICYQNCDGNGADAAQQPGGLALDDDTVVTEASLVPGPLLANYMERNGVREEFGIPSEVDLTGVRLNLLHPAVDRRFGHGPNEPVKPQAAASECPGHEGSLPNVLSPGSELLGFEARACTEAEQSPSLNITGSVSDPFTNAQETPSGLAWDLLYESATNQMNATMARYNEVRKSVSNQANMSEAWSNYVEKNDFDKLQLTLTPNCFMTVVEPSGVDPPDVRNGPCFGDVSKSFHHMRAVNYGGLDSIAVAALEAADGHRLGLHGGILPVEGAVTMDESCSGVFREMDC